MNFRNQIKIDFPPNQSPTPSKIIIDTHGGLQDILAIVFAYLYIQKSGIKKEIIGITCVSGKNSLENAVKSALVANKLAGAKIPVFRGQKEGLMLQKQYPKTFMDQKYTHIEHNLYESLDKQIKNWESLVQKQKAVDFISRSVKQHKGDVGIVSFGPNTNIALAHRLEQSLDWVKNLSLTGGQYLGVGNTVNGGVQANFAHDSLSSFILFEHGKKSKNLKDRIFVNVLEKSLSFCWKLAINTYLDSGKQVDPVFEDIFVNMMGINSIVLNCAPLLTILPVLEPKTVKKCYHCYGEIVRDGDNIDGLLAINWLQVEVPKEEGPFFYIYEDYDKQTITDLFVTAFAHK